MTMAYHRQHGIETRIVRIFNTYGPRMAVEDGRVLPAFFSQAIRGEGLTVFGDGSQTRSFCYVDDLVEGIYRLLLSDYHLPVNIGNTSEITMLDIAKEIMALVGQSCGAYYYAPLAARRPETAQTRHHESAYYFWAGSQSLTAPKASNALMTISRRW